MKYLIIGAGPSGLTFANRLLDRGIDDFIVLEKENEAGGLCRSAMVDGYPLDIGGGHFIDVRRPRVNEFLFRFLGEDEMNRYDRITKIRVSGVRIDYPFEANIWQLPIEDEIRHLKSIAAAGVNIGEEMPESFRDWIIWKLGKSVAEDYLIPYNEKIFSVDLNTLGTYWMNKLPDVSFEDTLRSCLMKQPYGTLPGHASFYYPKEYGSGELWLRMADRIKDHIEYGVDIRDIDLADKSVCGGKYRGDVIINTAPWTCFESIKGVSDGFMDCVSKLQHSSIVVKYLPDTEDEEVNWEYIPSPDIDMHRILYRNTFASGSKGSWAEINTKRYKAEDGDIAFISDYAYPLNTVDKPESIKAVLNEAAAHDVYGLGRWGEWEHYNSDLVVELAMGLADRLTS